MAHMQRLGLMDTIDTQQPLWSQQFDADSIEVAMDATMTAAWNTYQLQHPYRQLGEAHCEGRTLFCYAQHFLNINSCTDRRHVYHGIPASAWGPIMQLVTGRLKLRSVTAHWHGNQRSDSSSCPYCPGATEDPAHYVLECPAYNTIRQQCVQTSQAAAAVAVGADVSQVMLQLFVPSNFQELAAFLRKAYRVRFTVDGPQQTYAADGAGVGVNEHAADDSIITSGEDDSDDD